MPTFRDSGPAFQAVVYFVANTGLEGYGCLVFPVLGLVSGRLSVFYDRERNGYSVDPTD